MKSDNAEGTKARYPSMQMAFNLQGSFLEEPATRCESRFSAV